MVTTLIFKQNTIFFRNIFNVRYIAVSDSLPRTNDLKMVDRWLLFRYLVLFIFLRRFNFFMI